MRFMKKVTRDDPRLRSLADRIATARESRGLTLRDLAERANVSASTINRLENGRGLVSLEGFLALCDALDIPPNVALR